MPEDKPHDHSTNPNSPLSKTETKRQMHYLQELGEQLTCLHDRQRKALELSIKLEEAIIEFDRIKKHEARRRHLQYVGKLMRNEDETTIQRIENTLEQLHRTHQQNVSSHHAVERARDQILAQGDPAIQQFINDHSNADRQWLRQIYRQANHENEKNKPPIASRKLFKYLADIMGEKKLQR